MRVRARLHHALPALTAARAILMATTPLAVIGATLPVHAQADGSTAQAPTPPGDGEIVVTAEKRESTVQRTPISITALSGLQLQAMGISNLDAAVKEVPGVSIRTEGPGQTEFEMRGLNSGGGQSPTVGFYIDEAPIAPFANASAGKIVIDPDLYDLNRVEVLRGPQGTLYGAGSMGGTIRLITNQPSLTDFSVTGQASGSGTHSGGGNWHENLMVNLPLVADTLALRIVETYKHDAGYIDRIVLADFPVPVNGGLTRGDVTDAAVAARHDNVNTFELYGGRATLLWKPAANLTVEPMVMYQRISTGGESLVDNPPGNQLANYQPFDVAEPGRDEFKLASLTVNYDVGDLARLTSATSYWTRKARKVEDGSEALQTVLGTPGYAVGDGGIGANPWAEDASSRQFSSELRLSSTGPGRLQWTIGGFIGRFKSIFVQTSDAAGAAPVIGTTHLLYVYNPLHLDQEAAFADASYAITDSLKLNGGLRYYHYKSVFDTLENGFFGPNGASGPDATSHAVQTSSGVNPKVNLSYQPNGRLNIYGTIAKGFRPGGGNFQIATQGNPEADACRAALNGLGRDAAPQTYKSDSLWSYELGEKAKFMDGRLSINASVYHEDWSNVQRNIVLSCGYFYTDNAGKVRVNGSEVEIAAEPLRGLRVSESANYTHSVYADSSLEAGVVAGQFLPSVPKWTSSTRVTYTQELGRERRLIATLMNNFTGETNDVTAKFNRLPSYDLVNLRLSYVTPRWSAAIFADNVTNTFALLTDVYPVSLSIPSFNRATVTQPRTIGGEVSFNF